MDFILRVCMNIIFNELRQQRVKYVFTLISYTDKFFTLIFIMTHSYAISIKSQQ